MAMDKSRLWAKSCPCDIEPRVSMYLHGHLRDVYEAASRVLAETASAQLSALGLDESFRDRLEKCVKLAAAVHDLGKANDHFQGMILGSRNPAVNPQGLRHEWVTVLLMQQLRHWLLPAVCGRETDLAFVEWAVAGHHPAHNHASPPRSCPAGAGIDVAAHVDHPDFLMALAWLKDVFGLDDNLPTFEETKWPLVGGASAFQQLAKWQRAAFGKWERIRSGPEAKLLAAVKNCLIAADVAGSVLPKHGEPDWDAIPRAFADVPELGDLQRIATVRLGGNKPLDFQHDVAASKDAVTFVRAGCGTGKTVAAYLWAAQNYPTRRLYLCYPTTGTATEGFKDYLFEPEGQLGDIGAKLFHSRSRIDHEILLDNGRDTSTEEIDSVSRSDALEAWATPVVACTVDTVLGIVQNNRRGLFGWPALAQSAFVFDEIHAYDDRLFGALLRFLRDLPGLPALLMTASLPPARTKALQRVLRRHRNIELKPIPGPKELEEQQRYHRMTVTDDELLNAITKEVNDGGKVLWVSNTVSRVMAAANAAAVEGLSPFIYHSRFKYVDRVKRHRAVIDAFVPENKTGVLACTSQVCEMSLDLKGCTLLVTEAAPVPAMIQRLGRLNRHARPSDPTRPFIVVEPYNALPYTAVELSATAVWLKKLPQSDISQQMLVKAWEQSSDVEPELVSSAWLDGGPSCSVAELREAAPGITVVTDTDLAVLTRSIDLGGFTLPMPPPPKALEWKSWRKHRGIPVAPANSINYDPMRGATWQSE